MVEKASLAEALDRTTYLPNRTPEMVLTGEADAAFTDIGPYRDGTISVGFYSEAVSGSVTLLATRSSWPSKGTQRW
jgi:hypothetical protein